MQKDAVRRLSTLRRAACGVVLAACTCAGPAVRAQTAAAAAASAPAQPPVPIEAFFARPEIEQPMLSPSGRYLSILRPGKGERNALVMLDLQDTQKSRALATFSDADIVNVRWVGDDFLVFSLTDRSAGSGEQGFAPGLYSVAREDGEVRQLIKVMNPFFVQAPVLGTDRRLAPNHRLLFIPQDDSGEVIVGELQRGAGELTTVAPLRMNVKTLRTRSIGEVPPLGVNHWLFDAVGEPRVAVVEAQGRERVLWRAPGAETWKTLLDVERLRRPWSPAGIDLAGALYVVHAVGPEGRTVLSRFDFDQMRPAATPLVEVPGFDFRGRLISDRESGRTLGARALTDGEITVWSDPAMKALQATIDQRLPDHVNRLTCRRCDSDDRTVLVESWSDRDPGSVLVWQGRTQTLQRLGRALPAIDPRRMAAMDFQRIKARDGRDLPVWLTLPQRAPGSPPPPAVVLVHGGPAVRGSAWGWHALPQFLASRGYVVIEPEFRGSAGYGAAHERAGWKQWGRAMQADIADALRWAVAEGRADGRRACIAGASYGGYAALMGLVRDPDLYRCGIAVMAVTDLMRFVEGSFWWRDDIADEGRNYELRSMVGDPRTEAEMLRANSPVLLADRIRAPVLLVHGDQDLRVPIVHARDMRAALQKAGQEPEWLVFAGEGHGWRRLENERLYARRIEDFLARHLQDPMAGR